MLELTDDQLSEKLGLKGLLERVLLTGSFSEAVTDILDVICRKGFDTQKLSIVLKEHNVKDISFLKLEMLDVLIACVGLILNDHVITDKEHKDFTLLKKILKIREGDFYKHQYPVISSLIGTQLRKIYKDGTVDRLETIHKINLQGLFDLSYDQFLEFADGEILDALRSGADIRELDTARYPKGFNR